MGDQSPQTPRRAGAAGQGSRCGLSRRAAEAVVFLASAAVLVLELVAIRLVAPYVGITLQTSSAVIGTALAAIAVGAWGGGRLADRWDAAALLAPALGLGGALTVLTLPVVRGMGERSRDAPDVAGVLLLAMLAVFPPAALLSAVTPLVVKLHLEELARTGTVVGRISAIATSGAIAATFVTGFYLITAFTTAAIVIGTGGLLLLTAVVVAVAGLRARRREPGQVLRGTTVLMLLLLLTLPVSALRTPTPCLVETAYHCVRVEADPHRAGGRLLWLDNLPHSYVDLDNPRYLAFSYVAAMAVVADTLRPAGRPIASLSVGGGGLTLPRYLVTTRPGSTSTVLEIDPGVAQVVLDRLDGSAIPGLRLRIGDGRVELAGEPAGHYNLVIGDAFGGMAPPWHLATEEAVQRIRRTMTDDGVYAANIIDYRPQSFLRAELATLRTAFPHVALLADTESLAGRGGGNHVLIASRVPLPVEAIRRGLRAHVPDWDVLGPAATAAFVGTFRPLTDARAPVDQLLDR
jgi:MFS family permease